MTPRPMPYERYRLQTALQVRAPKGIRPGGRQPGGQRLLEPAQVREIRRLFHAAGFSSNQLAVRYNVSRQLITAITRGEIYKDVTDEAEETGDAQQEPEEPEPIEEEKVMSDVIAMSTHPAAPRLSSEELAQVVVNSVPCTLSTCNATPRHSCRKESGEARPPHRRRITLARRRGVI